MESYGTPYSFAFRHAGASGSASRRCCPTVEEKYHECANLLAIGLALFDTNRFAVADALLIRTIGSADVAPDPAYAHTNLHADVQPNADADHRPVWSADARPDGLADGVPDDESERAVADPARAPLRVSRGFGP